MSDNSRQVRLIHSTDHQPEGGDFRDSGCDNYSVRTDNFQPTPEEGLRLIKAFRRIRDASQRDQIIAQVEAIAGL